MRIALFLLPLTSNALTEGDYTYTISDEQAIITGFNSSYSGPLSITNTLGGYPVTSIQGLVFVHCDGLTAVTIPNSVGMIGDLAFYFCPHMTNVVIGSGVTNIGNFAFIGGERLTSVNLPDSVATVGDGAFVGCSSMTNVVIGRSVNSIGEGAFSSSALTAFSVSEDNSHYSGRDGILFNKEQTALLQYPCRRPGSHYTIPSGVTVIADSAFRSCEALVGITIPDSVINIGYNAFSHCRSLTSLTIPCDITSIGDNAFYYCTSMTRLFFKGHAPTLGQQVFDYVPATVYYLPGRTNWGTTYGDRPALCWNPTVQKDAAFGFTENRFGFNITGTASIPVAVEATTNLVSGVWMPLTNATLGASGSLSFTDPASSSLPARFYRIVWP